jgi:hypothetical protein
LNHAERYLTGPDFAIAAFKGEKQTLRPWNQQLPQPILLGDGRMIVSVSPQEGFLHQTYRNSIRWASTSRKQSAF